MFDTDENPPLNIQMFPRKIDVCAHYTAEKIDFFLH